jgi:hypothetical protein
LIVKKAQNGLAWAAWAGDADRLRRILVAADDLIDEYRKVALEKIDADEAVAVAELERPPDQPEDYPGQNEFFAEQIREQRTRYVALRTDETERWQLEVVTFEKDGLTQTLSGTPDQVMAGIDPYVVQGLRLRAPAVYGRAVSLTLSLRRLAGVSLEVEATDPGWVRKALATLDSEIRRGIPAEARLRKYKWTIAPCALIVIALLLIAFRGIIGNGKHEVPVAVAVLAATAMGLFIALFCSYALELYIPGFELLPRGKESRGRRLTAVAASFVVALVAAILATVLLH